ncbi:uncharacterized protein SAMN05216203_0848 [Marinobacter daqiaonensis]|uniref:Large ribosomal RNA subunit accumulation protein YceD n=2 Tax=Marinobacter daqiaonensis TaxID=650891 RepID=A0A1I6H3U7_9GAMM|nr:uncharacterized protein SAMN05216203_0848 [Marinobacter daqiaonensis]
MAETGAELEGTVPLVRLDRFRNAVFAIPEGGDCLVRLEFSADSQRRRIVRGELETDVELECQRCMSGMTAHVSSAFELGLVTSDDKARQLPSELEPFVVEGEALDLWTMVEDELLLALPAYPLHEREDCPATADLEALEADPAASPEPDPEDKRENPFKVLEGLKKTRH